MNISFSWLKQYIDLPDSVSADEVAAKLTMSTVEVEHVHHHGKNLENIVVGKVLKAEKHPNADKLKVCTVDVGNEKLQIVCGGSNVTEGMLCAVAKLGARVKWHGEGDLIEMKEAEIRGVKSYGMISASTEIGLGEMFPLKDEKEILDLTVMDLKVGQPLALALNLNDAVIEIDNKSMTHRPDLWGHYGLAREVVAVFKKDLKKYSTSDIKAGNETKIKVKVEDTKLCPRYMAVAISGVKVGPSPVWLAQKIQAIGLRPINNIVDITNFVMFDLGEPMHAFDKSIIENPKTKSVNINVRRAVDGEIFQTLDGFEHKLDSSMLVIAGSEKPIALAGIMGGEESGISDATTEIVFEAANFDAVTIRKAALKLGMRTDSSARFEKSLDPNLCSMALSKAVELTLQLCPGAKVSSAIVDEKKFHLSQGPIELDLEFLRAKIGQEIETKEVVGILQRLGFEVKEKKRALMVKIPTWRATKDISIPEDLVEEVARVYGFNNIAPELPMFAIVPAPANRERWLENKLRQIFSVGLGYSETMNYSFVSEEDIARFGADKSKFIELDNPIAKDRPFLRRNLIPGLLNNIAKNLENYEEVKLFEIGKVFKANEAGARVDANSDELLPRQDNYLVAVFANNKDKNPYWQARRVWETVIGELNLNSQVMPIDRVQNWEHSGRLALLGVNEKIVGVLSEVHPLVSQKFGIDARVGALQINLSALAELIEDNATRYQSLPKFPEVTRDLAFLVKKSVTHAEITAALHGLDGLLKKVELFDVYEGATIGDQYKSMAYRLTYGHDDRTLKSEEVDNVQSKAIKVLEKLGAEVRK